MPRWRWTCRCRTSPFSITVHVVTPCSTSSVEQRGPHGRGTRLRCIRTTPAPFLTHTPRHLTNDLGDIGMTRDGIEVARNRLRQRRVRLTPVERHLVDQP